MVCMQSMRAADIRPDHISYSTLIAGMPLTLFLRFMRCPACSILVSIPFLLACKRHYFQALAHCMRAPDPLLLLLDAFSRANNAVLPNGHLTFPRARRLRAQR